VREYKYKYLGYVMQRNGGQEAVRDSVEKAAAVMGQENLEEEIWEGLE